MGVSTYHIRAVTAHFGGFGRTVVVGTEAAEVDKVSQLLYLTTAMLFIHIFWFLSARHAQFD